MSIAAEIALFEFYFYFILLVNERVYYKQKAPKQRSEVHWGVYIELLRAQKRKIALLDFKGLTRQYVVDFYLKWDLGICDFVPLFKLL